MRPTQMINMLHEFIHEATLMICRRGQVSYTRIEIPGVTSVAKYFKHTIAENQQSSPDGDSARLSRKFHVAQHPHHETGRG